MTQTAVSGNTITYAYDSTGQRIKYAKGSTATYYPSKYYNITSAAATKHIFANGIEVAVVTGTGKTAAGRYIHTDNLPGSFI